MSDKETHYVFEGIKYWTDLDPDELQKEAIKTRDSYRTLLKRSAKYGRLKVSWRSEDKWKLRFMRDVLHEWRLLTSLEYDHETWEWVLTADWSDGKLPDLGEDNER